MNNKVLKRLFLSIAVVSIFSFGYIAGRNSCSYNVSHLNNRAKKDIVHKVKFWTSKKNIGQKQTKSESIALNIFKTNLTKCLDESLNKDEKNEIENIKTTLKKIAKESSIIEIKYQELGNEKDIVKIAKKVKKCHKVARSHMTKSDIRMMKSGISKMKIEQVIDFFEGLN